MDWAEGLGTRLSEHMRLDLDAPETAEERRIREAKPTSDSPVHQKSLQTIQDLPFKDDVDSSKVN
jgi:hypothetical protein